MQKLGYLPEVQNDMIFALICEELGIFGGICVIMLFVLLIWRCMIIASNATDLFSDGSWLELVSVSVQEKAGKLKYGTLC